jgi:hypothetical protein
MSYHHGYNSEDWVHVDHYNDDVSRLEKKVKELEEVVFEQDEEKVRLLAELMLLREQLSGQALKDITHLIYTHDVSDIKAAEYLLMEIEQ